MNLALFGTLIYIIFFVILPGAGGYIIRNRWRKFRKLLIRYSNIDSLEYNNLDQGKLFSFKGKLESFKTDNSVWLKGESLSICLDLEKQDIYSLASNSESISKTRWKDISSIIEGTPFWVFGSLQYRNGIPYLESSMDNRLLIIVSDSDENLFENLIRKGRAKNEIWNSYSPYSYITGVLILIILSYFSYKSSFNKIFSFYLLLIAGTPFYFILPPGLFFYLLHRRLWATAVRYSVLFDLKSLGRNSSLKFKKISRKYEIRSLISYVSGYFLNIVIAGIILFKLFQLIIFY